MGQKLPVGSYHVPFFGYPILVLGIYNHKFGYPKNQHGMSLQVQDPVHHESNVASPIGSFCESGMLDPRPPDLHAASGLTTS